MKTSNLDQTIKVGKGSTEIGLPFSRTYYRPTPRFWRKLGDNLLLIGTTIIGFSAFIMPPWVTAMAAGLTLAGKILTNCFKDDQEVIAKPDNPPKPPIGGGN